MYLEPFFFVLVFIVLATYIETKILEFLIRTLIGLA